MIKEKKKIYFDNINIIKFIKNFSTPIYLYDYKKIIFNLFLLKKIKIYCFYSIKANNLFFFLKLIKLTINKYDIVSIGELNFLILNHLKKPCIIFSGSGKTIEELFISISLNIFCINVESMQEILKLYFLCFKHKKNINIMIRINPNIDVETNIKIKTGTIKNKFGINLKNLKQILLLLKIIKINFVGYDFHMGSQIDNLKPIKKLFKLIFLILNIKKSKFIDIGGGLCIDYYESKKCIEFINFYNYVLFLKKKYKIKNYLIIEPGRFVFGNSCVILSKINYIKYNSYYKIAILDTNMNDNIRPSMYNAYHKIESFNYGEKIKNFFGPICESSDKFINKKKIKIFINSFILMYSCGSYCKVMSNNYNLKLKIFNIIYYKNKLKIIFDKEKINIFFKNYV